jgi:hypothetical protein
MKTLLTTLVIMLALVLTGMQNTFAQGTATVDWHVGIPQDCTCPLPGNAYWKVYCAVIDQCDTPYEIIYEDYQLVDGAETSAVFQFDEFCHGVSSDCYHVIASVDKLCPDGQGGFVETCSGKNPGVPRTCQDLMNYDTPVPITWAP